MTAFIDSAGLRWHAVEQAAAGIAERHRQTVRFPVTGTDRSLFAALLSRHIQRAILYILPGERNLNAIQQELRSFLDMSGMEGVPVSRLPRPSASPHDTLSLHGHIQAQRSEATAHIYSGAPAVILIPATAVAWGLSRASRFLEATAELANGGTLDLEQLAGKLVNAGYRRRDIVQEPGEFAIRGFVVDVFSPDHGFPVRAELFGDAVDSLRLFNPADQKSLARVDAYAAVPVRTIIPDEKFEAQLRGSVISNSSISGDLRGELLDQIIGGEEAPWFWNVRGSESHICSLNDAVSDARACVILDEPAACRKQLQQELASWSHAHEQPATATAGWVAKACSEDEALLDFGETPVISLASLEHEAAYEVIESGVQPPFSGSRPETIRASIFERIETLRSEGTQVVALLSSTGHMQRCVDILQERQTPCLPLESLSNTGAKENDLRTALESRQPIISVGSIRSSFLLNQPRMAFICHEDIFGKQRQASDKSKARRAFTIPMEELKDGDFIVHEDHGIGRFSGLKRIERGSDVQEFLQIEYSAGDRLLIPIDKMDKVQRYSTLEGINPRLDKLGGASWQKVKRRVKKALREMAGELMNLYAIRKTITGISFEPDTELMREFEASFPHVETPDQQKAMEEIKADMESDRPMDRLLCGDVGYGKTELAMRAAVKAAIGGTQVAVLAPTTILAQQHYERFSERLSGFPFTAEVLSRFRTGKEQKEILEKLKTGEIDILIGTHRLLGTDVQFKNLGLLIVDEEQRFGVSHKEKMKNLRKRIDVLSMTATPIPRTLHMSIAGVREMSLIQTPPRNRMAIHTRVLPFSEEVVRSAVEQELSRGGQVFYLRNRVNGIEESANRIARLVPDARTVIAHAQMPAERLETVMSAFVRGDYDVLVSTTIIENGIDIPNANTLIVERADRFGLSQLYQIRGRVGRSERAAYAYFLVPGKMQLTEDARRRLHAIREFSDLGSGFRIAAMDLEIRGAGTLLGGEQSGHIEAVGFDLYNRMLNNTIRELKGESTEEEFETTFSLQIDTHIPSDYIPEAGTRMKYYRASMAAGNELELEEVREEVTELFGSPPPPVRQLFTFATLRLLCKRMKIERVERTDSLLALYFTPDSEINAQALAEVLAEKNADFSGKGVLTVRESWEDSNNLLEYLELLLRRISS